MDTAFLAPTGAQGLRILCVCACVCDIPQKKHRKGEESLRAASQMVEGIRVGVMPCKGLSSQVEVQGL